MLQTTKKPRTFIRRGFGSKMTRLGSSYARTPPEALKGLVVLVVRFVAVNMGRNHTGGGNRRQRALCQEIARNEVETGPVLTR